MNYRLFKSLFIALLLSVVSLASPFGKETEWPAWRGGQYAGALSQGALDGASGLRVSWLHAVGSAYSAIVVAQGRVVTMASDHTNDYVIALDEESGDELWREPIAKTYPGRDGAVDGPVSTPVIDDDAVFALGPFGDRPSDRSKAVVHASRERTFQHGATLGLYDVTISLQQPTCCRYRRRYKQYGNCV